MFEKLLIFVEEWYLFTCSWINAWLSLMLRVKRLPCLFTVDRNCEGYRRISNQNVIKKRFSFHQIPNHHCNVRASQKPIRAGFWSKVEGWMDWICDQGWVLSPHLNPDPSSPDPVPIHSLFATNQLRCLQGISQFWFTNKKPSIDIKSKWALGDNNLMTEIMMMLMAMIIWWPGRTWGQ